MFSPLKRLILIGFPKKKFTKFSALLSLSVITFCLLIVFTFSFPFHTDILGYRLQVKPIDNSRRHLIRGNNFKNTFLLYTNSEVSVNSIQGQSMTEPNLKIHLNNSRLKSNSSGLKPSFTNWTERPWFLTNGSLRLSPVEASKLALWPEESIDPSDDRIVNQLMFVPMNYHKKTPLKSIYLSTEDNDWKISLGRREFLKCPVSSCQLVPGANSKNADLIFFKSRSSIDMEYFNRTRNPNQIWAKFEIESPQNVLMIAPDDSFNWTITYRHDSEVSVPYYKFYPYEKLMYTKNRRNYAANKTGKVAWFVSNCFASNSRLEYATELSQYISVDIFGFCGPLKCLRDNSECRDLLNTKYKFYLSFENSNCLDYITEKFWYNGLMNDILPIVMGAHPSTYKRLAPPHSYIHVDDFDSPKHMAEYLNILDTNDELYNKYFEWKGTGQIKQIYMWCRVCALLHAPKRRRTYNNLSKWWDSNNTCVSMTWTNMKVSILPIKPMYP